LGGAEPRRAIKFSIGEGFAHREIGNSVTIDITDCGHRKPKKRGGIFRHGADQNRCFHGGDEKKQERGEAK
jgi:hypothetical protein